MLFRCLLGAHLPTIHIRLFSFSFLCWWTSFQEWKNAGVEQLWLSTIDMTGVPTLANLQKGVQFALKYQSLGQSVYVHCKAGRSRSATMVAAYLIQVEKVFLDRSPLQQISSLLADLARSHVPNFRLLGGGKHLNFADRLTFGFLTGQLCDLRQKWLPLSIAQFPQTKCVVKLE